MSVDNVGDFTNLRIDDSADTAHRDVIINALGTFGLTPASVSYKPSDINILALLGGSGGNTFTIDDTFKAASSTSASATIITTGPGNDQVNVRGTTGQLIIDGQSGSDTIDVGNGNNSQNIRGDVSVSNLGGLTALNLHNSADPTGRGVTVDANSGNGQNTVTGLMPAKVSFVANDVKTLGISTGGGVDTYFVRGTQGRTATSLHTGGGNDRVFVGSVDNTLDTIRAPVRVDGEGNADELQIIDNLATGPHTYTQTATSLSRSGAATISYFSIEDLKVFKGPTSGNTPLVKDLQLRESVNAGEVVTLTGVLSDQNKKDKLTLTVDWGDGSAPSVTKPKQRPFAQKHKYAAPGEYTVRVIWSDNTGESNSRDLPLTVAAQSGPSGPRALMHRRS